ncbi:uncharacterized protein LOC115444190 [Manduca sexta]|uniref:MADF domain-containing protein n=1 Tax=Manduca sexta TaxID=7130 RepID=A0A922CLA9_MANSE|nr:uncharacterized protein LOC115444190 [Manduca sexta]XP_030025723.1 uncharacterized protein LOC115444190 [Manduca sexta]KAG6451144.1 hypothetical protein O3G_MSEX006951 [Manduca sexta]KAG6451145.1 hypothetical protein O3G_MSEX006951 [Manduca sexta]
MSFTSEDLILAVMRRPALWDPSDPGYSDKNKVNMMWKQIQRLNKYDNVVRIRKKWKNLRDQYRKELKKYPPARPGQPPSKFKSTWKHFDAMSFVRDQVSRNLGEPSAEPQDSDDSDEEQDRPLRETAQARVRGPSPDPSESSSMASRKRSSYDLRLEFVNIQKKKLLMQQKELREKRKREKQRERERCDDDYMFLMTLLPHMRQFSQAQKLRVRNRMYSVVLAELEGQGQFTETFEYDNKIE